MSANEISLKTEPNKTKKWTVVILLIPIIISFFQLRDLDNDFYFLYATGEYIVKHGFPFTDMLSMHSSMKIVVQQWLSSVIFYYVYSFLGRYGIITLLYLCNIAICLLLYSLIKLITGKPVLAAAITAGIDFLLFDAYMVTRPQMFTYVVLLAEVYFLEKHVKTKKVNTLFAIPVLSLLLINLHAAMWAMLLVFMLPYLVSAVAFDAKTLKVEAQGNLFALLITMAVSIMAGLLNPYSFDNMLYLTSSYGQKSLSLIKEMYPTSLSSMEGMTFFGLFGITILIVCFIKKRLVARRFFLLYAGTLLLGMLQIKGIPYFYLFGVPAFAFMLKDIDFAKLKKPLKNYNTKSVRTLGCIFLSLCLVYLCEARFFMTKDIIQSNQEHIDRLEEVATILDQVEEPIVLYANFNDGQYFEFRGYHPYIDGRAELFLAQNNKQYDYFAEYENLINGKIYYQNFVNKYNFNYYVLCNGPDSYLLIALLHDDDFEIVYVSEEVILMKKA